MLSTRSVFHAAGTSNVLCVDGSLFPTAMGANPMVTILAIALLNARRFVAVHPLPGVGRRRTHVSIE